jgi:hypothetical protein
VAWRLTKVAANVLLNTRAGVLADCAVRSRRERTDQTCCRTSPVDPSGTSWAATYPPTASTRGARP